MPNAANNNFSTRITYIIVLHKVSSVIYLLLKTYVWLIEFDSNVLSSNTISPFDIIWNVHYKIFVLLRHKNEVKDFIKEAYVQFKENGNVIIQHGFKYLQK